MLLRRCVIRVHTTMLTRAPVVAFPEGTPLRVDEGHFEVREDQVGTAIYDPNLRGTSSSISCSEGSTLP